MKTKTKYARKEIVKPDFVDLDKMDLTKPIKILRKEEDFKGTVSYIPVEEELPFMTEAMYEALSKSNSATYIGYPIKADPTEYMPLKMMKTGENVTGYTSTVCELVNTAKEVADFDRSKLDLEAYALWAEDLLENWKASADFPELGMIKVDDSVRKVENSAKRVSKKSLALDILSDVYANLYSNFA